MQIAARVHTHEADVKTLSLSELLERLEAKPRPTLVEALNLKAYREGHLPGALHLPRSRVEEQASLLLPDLRAEIIVYCRGST